MPFNLLGSDTNKSPEMLSERRALVRALIMRQLSQRPRDMWDGINNLVGAISSRIAQDQLSKAEAAGQQNPDAGLAPLVEALKKRQSVGAPAIPPSPSNARPDPGERKFFFKPMR